MKKLAVFGGTFNPIHRGHLSLCIQLADALDIPEVWLMPDRMPPHKPAPELAPAADRLAMCRLAAAGDPRLSVSDMEIRREGPSYTYLTVRQLKKEQPERELYWFVGSDMLLTLLQWKNSAEFLPQVTFCAGARQDGEEAALAAAAREIEAAGGRCLLAPCQVMECSSTGLRRRAAAGEDLSEELPAGVWNYILEHHLYGR
ncbi:MAG: nicotinate (nicotinamide) nucleotide adenylyltransferase [Oscillospiraceae bacterium]|nr:nicotinate (nicotinamide) nucleotide adenylyltransferase [Oscillospiraceae bacterium]